MAMRSGFRRGQGAEVRIYSFRWTLIMENGQDDSTSGRIDEEFLSLLACPLCGGALCPEETAVRTLEVLACGGCGSRFPVREGIPVLLAEERLTDP